MQEAILYQKLDDSKVKCAVCNHRCVIAEGKRGICRVRENQGGTLYALTYGKTIAAHVDPIEKKPLYHFMPGTWIYSFATMGCNFRCSWCQNWDISQSPRPAEPVLGTEITPEQHVAKALEYGCPSIAYTYNEPTVWIEYALDTMKLAREKGLKNVWVTNGYMSRESLELITPYMDAANVDFKGPNDGVYEKYCGARPEPIMENLIYLHRAGVHIEVTTLVVPGINDKSDGITKIAEFIARQLSRSVPWHVTRFFPAWKMMDTVVTPIETLKMAEKIGRDAGLRYVHVGNV